MQKLAQQTERGFSYGLDLRESSAWTSSYDQGGGVEVNSGMLEKIDFHLKNKEALGLKGYTDQATGEFISYENLSINDVIAAMIATEMAHSELSHSGRWFEVSALVTLIAGFTKISSAQTLNALVYLYYLRQQTYEADKAGAVLVSKAGYNPAAILFLNDIHDKCRPYFTKALSKIYLAAPSCHDRQAATLPVVREWKALSKVS
ncbi:MAG: hypothetical protein KFB93_08185 [Simkaniaceae bacterium]|nr:MAG: hypothetical protein KFB93_08185 [Simkaniaceae bacterium]